MTQIEMFMMHTSKILLLTLAAHVCLAAANDSLQVKVCKGEEPNVFGPDDPELSEGAINYRSLSRYFEYSENIPATEVAEGIKDADITNIINRYVIQKVYPCVELKASTDPKDVGGVVAETLAKALDTRFEHWYLLAECSDSVEKETVYLRLDYVPCITTLKVTPMPSFQFRHLEYSEKIEAAANSISNNYKLDEPMILAEFLQTYCAKAPSNIEQKHGISWNMTGLKYYSCQEFVIDAMRILGKYEKPNEVANAYRTFCRNPVLSIVKGAKRIIDDCSNKQMEACRVNKRHFLKLFPYRGADDTEDKYIIEPDLSHQITDYIPFGRHMNCATRIGMHLGKSALDSVQGYVNKLDPKLKLDDSPVRRRLSTMQRLVAEIERASRA